MDVCSRCPWHVTAPTLAGSRREPRIWRGRATLHLAWRKSHSKSQGRPKSPEDGEQQRRAGNPRPIRHPSASTTANAYPNAAAAAGRALRTPPVGSTPPVSSREATSRPTRDATASTEFPASLTTAARVADVPEAPLSGVRGGR
ncbi:hypothetical protein NDU88_001140 [Pleurodeles waltl]|uniref:Uncharacterized protein n=1 Tax=Pleurodeles waltl TaxID=8319 RepID=A0AAV7URY6_PLEWA|nr:hypothetical protein NDU88_001140 [Pleurodeles waltl]